MAKASKQGAWAFDSSYDGGELVETLTNAGLDPSFTLHNALADFYIAERLEADRRPRAAHRMAELESRIAREFAIYMNLACGGELRHMPYVCEVKCWECDGEGSRSCGECYGEGTVECWECDGTGELECPACDGDGTHECDDDECDGLCEDCEGNGTRTCDNCDGNGSNDCNYCEYGATECQTCYGSGRHDGGDWEDWVKPGLHEFFSMCANHGSHRSRTAAWEHWVRFRARHGPKATDWMAHAFKAECWPDGYGGKAWHGIAKLLADYENGRISARVFVNMAWSLEHNGGCVFNKLYRTEGLKDLLNVQARGEYDALAMDASPEIREAWHYWQSPAASCKAAERVMAAERMNATYLQGGVRYPLYAGTAERMKAGLWDGD